MGSADGSCSNGRGVDELENSLLRVPNCSAFGTLGSLNISFNERSPDQTTLQTDLLKLMKFAGELNDEKEISSLNGAIQELIEKIHSAGRSVDEAAAPAVVTKRKKGMSKSDKTLLAAKFQAEK